MRSDLPINNLEKILSTLNSSLFLSQKVGVHEARIQIISAPLMVKR